MPVQFRRSVIMLALVEAIIIGVHLLTLVAAYGFGRDYLFGLNPLFDVDLERNVPTFFSFALLLVAAFQLAVITRTWPAGQKPRRALWAGLSAAFFYLAADEGFEIHERANRLFGRVLGGEEMTFYAWLIPYSVVALVFGLIYLRFLRQLPRNLRNQFIIGGLIYLGGAFGAEVLGGIYVHFQHTERALGYDLLSALEETLEMAGVIWFINALSYCYEKNGAPMLAHRSAVSQPEKRSASTSA